MPLPHPRLDNPWITRPSPQPDAPVRLVCLSYAGGGASAFRAWPARLPGVDVLPVQLPGRETRMLEPSFDRMPLLVDALADAVAPELDRPYAVFGHSMGARIGFELVRELRRRDERPPVALFASACKAPHLPRAPMPKFDQMPENVFVARLRNMNGTPPEVFDDPELLELVLPAIRADFAVVDHYEYVDEAALACPIRAYGGTMDTEAREDELLGWQAHTTTSYALQMLHGGHFTIVTHECEMTESVGAALQAITE